MHTETLIPGTQTVNETLRRFPATVTVFKAFGIDSCCGGGKTIASAAALHGIDPAMLLEILEDAARGEAAELGTGARQVRAGPVLVDHDDIIRENGNAPAGDRLLPADEGEARALLQSCDQRVAQGRSRRPDAAGNGLRVLNQTHRGLGNHLRG